jgi:hypothetical protein
MKTKLEYVVYRNSETNKIESRSAEYTFTGESKEVDKNIDQFENILLKNGFKLHGCPCDEIIKGKRHFTDSCMVWDKDDFDRVKNLLKEFKRSLSNHL